MITDTVIKQFQMCNYVIKANVGDVTQEESLVQPKPAGNCVNWTLGHILAYRYRLLRGLGAQVPRVESDFIHYERHGAPLTQAENAKPVSELLSELDETLGSLESEIRKLTPEKLAEKAMFIQEDEMGGTYETALAAYAFHDAYHSGQTGLLRRITGKPPVDM